MVKKKQKSKEMLDEFSIEMLKKIIVNNSKTTLAHLLAKTGKWHTYNKEILKLAIANNKNTVAYYLARFNPEWQINDKEILLLKNIYGETVAHYLARKNSFIKEDKKLWRTYIRDILKIKLDNDIGNTIAHIMALDNQWITFDKEILFLKNNVNASVASFIYHNPLWCTYNIEILNSDAPFKITIKDDLLDCKRYIASKVKKNVLTIVPII